VSPSSRSSALGFSDTRGSDGRFQGALAVLVD
jgi:hypothetical protein